MMSEPSSLGLSMVGWVNTIIIIALLFHIFVGLPNVLYLCTVYKIFYVSWKRGKLKASEISKLNGKLSDMD